MSEDKIRFVTDSAADIPAALQRELDIQVLPFMIAMEDRELQDGVDFTPQEFYARLTAAPHIPTHSQLTPTSFLECYESAWKAGHAHLIYTAINAKGSSTHQNALQARAQFYEEHPSAQDAFSIHVIDSMAYTMGYGWAVVQGARMAREGAGCAAVLDHIRDWVAHVRILFAPYDLKYAKKSGRVSAAAAFVGEALGLKPVMTFEDGVSKICAKVRGEKNIIPAILELCQKGRQPGTPYLCIHGSHARHNQELSCAAREALGEEPALEYSIGGVIAINAGPNVAGLVYREK